MAVGYGFASERPEVVFPEGPQAGLGVDLRGREIQVSQKLLRLVDGYEPGIEQDSRDRMAQQVRIDTFFDARGTGTVRYNRLDGAGRMEVCPLAVSMKVLFAMESRVSLTSQLSRNSQLNLCCFVRGGRDGKGHTEATYREFLRCRSQVVALVIVLGDGYHLCAYRYWRQWRP